MYRLSSADTGPLRAATAIDTTAGVSLVFSVGFGRLAVTMPEALLAQARLMIGLLHPPHADRLVEIATRRRGVVTRRRPQPHDVWHSQWFGRTDIAAEYAIEQVMIGVEIYAGVNPRFRMRSGAAGRNEDIAAVTDLPLDFDRRKGQDPSPALNFLSSGGIPPALTIESGGGTHLHTLLAEGLPVDVGAGLAKRLHLACGGDAVHDARRIMRVPGTFNHREPQAWCHIWDVQPDRRYSARQVIAVLDAAGVPTVSAEHAPRRAEPIDAPADMEALWARLSPETVRAILQTDGPIVEGVFSRTDGGQTSWSEVDYRLIARIIREADASDEQIEAIFAAFPIGAMSARKKRSGYLTQTIKRVRSNRQKARQTPAVVRAPSQLRVELVRHRDGLWVLPPLDLDALDEAVLGPMPDVPPEFLSDRGSDPRSN